MSNFQATIIQRTGDAPRGTERGRCADPTPSPSAATTGRRRLIYVLAASHSGSTLLTMLLARHPQLCTIGELKCTIHQHTIDTYVCSCGRSIRQCPFWERIGAAMAARGHAFDLERARVDIESIDSAYVRRLIRPLHRAPAAEWVRDAALSLSPAWRREIDAIQTRTVALIDGVCAEYRKPIIVDSSKYALRLKYLLRDPGLDVSVVRLIRDGRGVALTYYKDEKRLGMHDAAMEWRRSNEEAEHVLRRLPPGRAVEARYEDLCAGPRETLQRIFASLGLPAHDVALDFRSGEHHIVGNWMRLVDTSEIRLDDRWKSMLSAEDLLVFDEVAGPLNRRYGYE